MKKWHDATIVQRELNVGDSVLYYNTWARLFTRKLKSKWSGPFRVTQLFTKGAIEVKGKEELAFKVNDQRLKLYLRDGQEIYIGDKAYLDDAW